MKLSKILLTASLISLLPNYASAQDISACVNLKTGLARFALATKCNKKTEKAIVFNSDGNTGPQGPQGLKGDTGPQGPKGDLGAKGDSGNTGPQGPKGDTGAKGDPGNTLVPGTALNAVLDDLTSNISIVKATGTCSSNPYPATFNDETGEWEALNPPCPPVSVQCPQGTIIASSQCNIIEPSTTEKTTILDQLSEVFGNPRTDLGKPFNRNSQKTGSAVRPNVFQCNADLIFNTNYYNPNSESGYTPWCFFKVANVVSIPGQKYTTPYTSDFNYNTQRYEPTIYLRDVRDDNDNGITITQQQLNDPANYDCHTIEFEAKARCITEPTNLLKKLLD